MKSTIGNRPTTPRPRRTPPLKPRRTPPSIRSGWPGTSWRAWSLASPAPCYLINEGVVIALADDADGMAVVKEDRVVRI
jgi:hypothetical protein